MKIGFDLWGTLIEANPMFKERRKDLFDRYKMGSHDVCEFIMSQIKSDLNKIVEDSGWQPNANTICQLFATRFNKPVGDMWKFYQDYQLLAELYSPKLINPDTKEILGYIEKPFQGCVNELYIISNTMFISGKILRSVLYSLDIANSFEYFIFSDEKQHSKPDTRICDHKLDYFIGDNPKTDGVYAERIGAEYLQINSNEKTLKDVYNFITATSR